jgi:hypothetical protein
VNHLGSQTPHYRCELHCIDKNSAEFFGKEPGCYGGRGRSETQMPECLVSSGLSNQKKIFSIKNASATDDTVATIPGIMKLWFTTYLPMRVVPVWSNDIAASNVA